MNNKLNSFLERAKKIPELGFVEAINIDRFFKANNISELGTFSQNGFSPNLTISNISISKKLKKNKNTLKKIEDLKTTSKEAYVRAFQELEGIEIETLNLLYANYLVEQHDYIAWKYFFNKYLISRKGFKIKLKSFVFDNIFEVIESEKSTIRQEAELVSVIMPSYNSEKTISYAIESILKQTHQNIELIIVDDCSTDNTEKICKEFIAKDSRVKFIKNKQNSGAYISRNNGLKIANGDYITILDADDFSFAERITYQLERIKDTKAKAHLGYYLRINEKGKFVSFRITGKFSYDGALHKCLASMMIEKKFFDEVLGYWDSVRFGADSELYYRILAIDEKLIVEDIVPLYLALDRENSLTNSEATKIGGELRSQYAKSFLDFHQNSTVEKLYYSFPQTKRPFVVPKEMELDSTIQIDITQLSVEPITDLQQLKKIKSNISRFDFLTEEFKYQCLWQLNKKSKYLFVLFHGANDRSKKQPPYFKRWSWQNDFNGSILNISDPTLALDDKLRLAWYIGNKNEYPVKTIVSVVKEFANIHGIENSNIIFYGSSGAGYTSLACSRYIPNSNAVAINAQTNVLNYHQGHVTDMLKACFDSIDQNEIWQKYKERLDMVDYYSNNKYSNNIFLVQNEKDEFHYKNHFLPFIEKTNLSKEKILLYSNESGHGSEPRNMVKEILKKAGIGNNFLWLSMGENCLTDNILQRFNKKSFSTPYSSNRTNIDYILTCEKDRYKTLLLKENLVYDTLFDKKVVRSKFIQKCDDIYDKYHMKGFEFTHHDVIESQKDRESYDRRSKRLLDGREKENFVFLYFHRYNPKSNIELLRKKLNDLISFYKGNQNSVFIIFFYQQLIKDTSKRRIEIKKINDNFFEYVYHTQFNWEGNNPEIFWGLNDNDLISEMIKDVEQKISNIENKTEITINKNFNINNKKIFLLGTCRLHRLFIKNTKGQIIDNTDQRLTIEYPKIGFFHTLPEILQIIKWVKRDVNIPSNLAKYIFRKENPSTTPQNEFDESLEKAIKENQLIESPKMDLKEIDYFIFEICSLKAYFDTESKLYFHANPNFAGNIAYNQIPKEGIYSKNALNIPSVENQFQSTDLMEKHFSELFKIIDPQKTIIFGHLLDPNNPNQARKEVNDVLNTMSKKYKFHYIDTSIFVKKYGFNEVNGKIDIHHLTNEGEIKLGQHIQSYILNNLQNKDGGDNEALYLSLGENCLTDNIMNYNFDIYINDTDFIITNQTKLTNTNKNLRKIENSEFYIFGYCFVENDIVKNSKITKKQFQYILENKDKNSGIFVAISKEEDTIRIVFDPLVQYNVFYHLKNNLTTISNNIFLISELHNLKEEEDNYLFDNIAYKSPLRGLTILKDVFIVQYDDLLNNKDVIKYKTPLPLQIRNLEFAIPDNEIYSHLTYEQLLEIYLGNLKKKAKIIAEKFNEVHIQLTGGADSRLVLTLFLNYKNLYCYVYGDGASQDRLCYESLVEKFNLQKSENIIFAGKIINNSSLIFRSLYDSNSRKISGIGLYMNSDDFVFENKCKITGYYGANVSGGIRLPPANIKNNSKTKFVPDEYFTYHDYVKLMKTKYEHLSEAALRDVFYLNNRGPSHYGTHSIADNLKSNSFDILYDPINIELVKKCPYSDSEIDGNAISIDLIYMNNPELALFPYDRRKIPKYKEFNNVPTINCFDGFMFKETVVERMNVIRPSVSIDKYDLLNRGSESISMLDLLKYEEIAYIFDKYPFLENIIQQNDIVNATRIVNYVLSIILLNKHTELN